jgi:hypothetical protein
MKRGNKELRTQNEALFSQRNSALAQLNVMVEEKKAMELDLYHKVRISFVVSSVDPKPLSRRVPIRCATVCADP